LVDTIPLNEIISVSEMNNDEAIPLRSLKGSSQTILRSSSVISDRVLLEQIDVDRESKRETVDRDSKRTAAKGHRLNILQIKTAPDGFNFGRTYYFKANIDVPGQAIVADLLHSSKVAKERMDRKSRFLKSQEIVRYFQESVVFQIIVAFLILLVIAFLSPFRARSSRLTRAPPQNFLVNAAEAQLVSSLVNSDGTPTSTGNNLEDLDTFFTIIFAVELAINAYAHWFRPFVSDGWNAFDVLVVSLSLVALGPISMPVNVLRSMRAFRVVRLFGRMGALRDIISSLSSAIVPVLNAFLIMLIVSSVCEHSLPGPSSCRSRTACLNLFLEITPLPPSFPLTPLACNPYPALLLSLPRPAIIPTPPCCYPYPALLLSQVHGIFQPIPLSLSLSFPPSLSLLPSPLPPRGGGGAVG
jgi:hypothetical protein